MIFEQKFLRISYLSMRARCRTHLILLYSVPLIFTETIVFFAQYYEKRLE
jgi:hypothetical protein